MAKQPETPNVMEMFSQFGKDLKMPQVDVESIWRITVKTWKHFKRLLQQALRVQTGPGQTARGPAGRTQGNHRDGAELPCRRQSAGHDGTAGRLRPEIFRDGGEERRRGGRDHPQIRYRNPWKSFASVSSRPWRKSARSTTRSRADGEPVRRMSDGPKRPGASGLGSTLASGLAIALAVTACAMPSLSRLLYEQSLCWGDDSYFVALMASPVAGLLRAGCRASGPHGIASGKCSVAFCSSGYADCSWAALISGLRDLHYPADSDASRSLLIGVSDRGRRRRAGPSARKASIRLPTGQPVGDGEDGSRMMAETAMAAFHLDVFRDLAFTLDAVLPVADTIRAAVDRGGGNRRRFGYRAAHMTLAVIDLVAARIFIKPPGIGCSRVAVERRAECNYMRTFGIILASWRA